MARSGGDFTTLLTYGLLAFVGVEIAAGGLIGIQAQQAGRKIADAIGLKVFISPPGSSAAAAGSPAAKTPIAPVDCNVAFLPGVQYVSQLPDGTFQVVVRGRVQATFPTQAQAENAYNLLVCPK